MNSKELKKVTKKLVEADYLIGIISDKIYGPEKNDREELREVGQRACDALAKAIVLATKD